MDNKKNKLNIKLTLKLKIFLLLFIIIISILIGFIISSFKEPRTTITKYKSDYIEFLYDNTFNIANEKEYIELRTNDKKATVIIKKIDYTSNAKIKDKYDISSSLAYQVVKDKDNYIETYNDYFVENNITRYYHLYENYNEKRQIEVINNFTKNYIYVVIFSANSNEFDLYSESLSIIINSIKV